MLRTACRCSRHVECQVLYSSIRVRHYTQQKAARVPRSSTQQSTVKPAPGSQVKNRNALPAQPSSSKAPGASAAPTTPIVEQKVAEKVRREAMAKEARETGQEGELIRMSLKLGNDPWAQKMTLMDLCIPTPLAKAREFSKEKSLAMLPVIYLRALGEKMNNSFQNILSMYRLASDYAFTGIVTKRKLHPQIFATKSIKDSAWIAPYRAQILERYKVINEAIASGDARTLKDVTAYEYHDYAMQLLRRNAQRPGERSYTWKLHSLVSPVRILSLRAFPAYYAQQEPTFGNRNCVQAVVRFETLQTLTARNRRGQVIKPDGSVAEPGWEPEPKRVLEYLVFENKMFYRDGWYAREQMFEGIQAKYKEI